MDSDDEWEEEEPGESLSHSEGVSNPGGCEASSPTAEATVQLADDVGQTGGSEVLVLHRLVRACSPSFPSHMDKLLEPHWALPIPSSWLPSLL